LGQETQLMVAEWIVNKGGQDGAKPGADCVELRFEELVGDSPVTLATLAKFIEHDLDYDRILQAGIGSVSDPNTSFKNKPGEKGFSPVGRWKKGFWPENLEMFEGLVGGTLEELGYLLATTDRKKLNRPELKRTRWAYQKFFDSKLYLKAKTPLGRLQVTRDLSWL
jgi:hypothetical protein